VRGARRTQALHYAQAMHDTHEPFACVFLLFLQAGQHLKAEGNRMHSAGNYQGALEKYERAKSNVRCVVLLV